LDIIFLFFREYFFENILDYWSHLLMREISKSYISLKIDVTISEIINGIYRILRFSNEFGIIFNQFLTNSETLILIQPVPIGRNKYVKKKRLFLCKS
jgi:hypothetical protein